jgi:hypothetical protein
MKAFSFSDSQDAVEGTRHPVRKLKQSISTENLTVWKKEDDEDAKQNGEDSFRQYEPGKCVSENSRFGARLEFNYHFHPDKPLASTPLKAKARTPLIMGLKLPRSVTQTTRGAISSGRYQ